MKRTRRLSCKEKTGYDSKQQADGAMRSYSNRNLGGIRMNAESYKCHCGKWHWGHSRPRKR